MINKKIKLILLLSISILMLLSLINLINLNIIAWKVLVIFFLVIMIYDNLKKKKNENN